MKKKFRIPDGIKRQFLDGLNMICPSFPINHFFKKYERLIENRTDQLIHRQGIIQRIMSPEFFSFLIGAHIIEKGKETLEPQWKRKRNWAPEITLDWFLTELYSYALTNQQLYFNNWKKRNKIVGKSRWVEL